MNKKIIMSISAALVALSIAAPAFADTSVQSNTSAHANIQSHIEGGPLRVRIDSVNSGDATTSEHGSFKANGRTASSTPQGGNHIEKGQALGKAEIEKRIKSLEDLSSRIAGMKRLSVDQITQIQASIQAEISILTSLEATIGSDTSTTTLKADVESITKANRVYLLVMPQAQISAAADRILAAAGQLENLSVKLSARIDAAATAGTDVSTLRTALSDMNAKVADAKVQANAAVSESANLKADNGDATIKASNSVALKDARTKLEAARADIQAAYKDAQTIVAGVRGKGEVKASAHAQATTTENVQ